VTVSDKEVWTCSADSQIIVWNLETEISVKRVLTAHKTKVHCMVLVNGNSIWSGDADGQILIWDIKTHKCTAEVISEHGELIRAMKQIGDYVWTGSYDKKVPICIAKVR